MNRFGKTFVGGHGQWLWMDQRPQLDDLSNNDYTIDNEHNTYRAYYGRSVDFSRLMENYSRKKRGEVIKSNLKKRKVKKD